MSTDQDTIGRTQASEFFRLERRESDLPFYRGVPVKLALSGWLIVLCALAVGYLLLVVAQQPFHEGLAGFIPPILFVAAPLIALAIVAGRSGVMSLFRPIRPSDFLTVVGFFILNWIVTILLGMLAIKLFSASANPASGMVTSADTADRVLFYGWTAVQLVGEELITILPFLAFLAFLDRLIGRKAAIILAAFGASVIFSLIHLPAYQWNVPHVLFAFVPIRMVLLAPYILTRNLWVSAATHILNDWTIFTIAILAAPGSAT